MRNFDTKFVKVNFLLRKISLGNLNEAISLAEIASFRFPHKLFLKRKLAIKFLQLQEKPHR